MSKLGIISDIHGNYPALLAVMRKLDAEQCDSIICLGDIVGYYSMVNECISLLQKKNVFCLQGNHETYILGKASCPRSRSAMDCIEFQKNIITKEHLSWLNTLEPLCIQDDMVAIHGGLHNNVDEYVNDFDFVFAGHKYPGAKIFLTGHTHIQKIQRSGEHIYCNPGSVGQPRDHINTAAYAILENGDIRLERVAYDIDLIAASMQEAGFSDYYYRNLYEGKRIGEQ